MTTTEQAYLLWVTFEATTQTATKFRRKRSKEITHALEVIASSEAEALDAGKRYCEGSRLEWRHISTEVRDFWHYEGWTMRGKVSR